jgi:hypothetical protein
MSGGEPGSPTGPGRSSAPDTVGAVGPYGGSRDDEGAHGERLSDEQAAMNAAIAELTRVRLGATVLRIASYLASAVWLIAIVSTFWTVWEQSAGQSFSPSGVASGSTISTAARLRAALATTAAETWGYLLVAVLAFAAATLLASHWSAELLDDLGDDEDLDELGSLG